VIEDVLKLGIATLTPGERAQLAFLDPADLAERGAKSVKRAELDLGAGEDGIPRRLGAVLEIDSNGSNIRLSIDASLNGVNEQAAIAPPAGPTRPMQALAVKLQPAFARPLLCLTNAQSEADLARCQRQASAAGAQIGQAAAAGIGT
jgi:hypothetical protein